MCWRQVGSSVLAENRVPRRQRQPVFGALPVTRRRVQVESVVFRKQGARPQWASTQVTGQFGGLHLDIDLPWCRSRRPALRLSSSAPGVDIVDTVGSYGACQRDMHSRCSPLSSRALRRDSGSSLLCPASKLRTRGERGLPQGLDG